MKSPPFRYHRPTRAGDALALLGQLENYRLLAGGQSLVPMLNFRLLYPDDLVDLNGIPELAGIEVGAAQIRIGAMTRQRAVEADGELAAVAPIFREAILQVGHRQTRNRGTVGGSLCQLDPAAEIPALAVLHDATIHIESTAGRRDVAACDFIEGAMSPGLRAGEMLAAVSLPSWPKGHGYAFLEHAKRAGDFALASVGCLVAGADDGTLSRVSICVGGLGDRPVRLSAAESLLQGALPSDDLFAKCAAECASLEADGNHHASADYKRSIAQALVKRALALAVSRCKMSVPS